MEFRNPLSPSKACVTESISNNESFGMAFRKSMMYIQNATCHPWIIAGNLHFFAADRQNTADGKFAFLFVDIDLKKKCSILKPKGREVLISLSSQ
jgi:hypothetical protein